MGTDRLDMDLRNARLWGRGFVRRVQSQAERDLQAGRRRQAGTEPKVNLYGAYSQAFLPPRAPSSLTPANVEIDLVPEDIENYEGGLKASVMNGRLALEASYFQMTEDGVVLSKRQGPFFIPTNAGQRKYKGFETGAGWGASTAISLYLNASFYHHRYGDFTIESADGDTILDGNRLEMSPDHIISWGAIVRPAPPISATFDVKHVGGCVAERVRAGCVYPNRCVRVVAGEAFASRCQRTTCSRKYTGTAAAGGLTDPVVPAGAVPALRFK